MNENVKISMEQLLSLYENQRSQLEALNQQINSLGNLLMENNMAHEALTALSEPGADDILFSLGAGIFVDAKVADLKKVKGNIGGNVVEEMTIKDALEKLDDRQKKIQVNIEKLRAQETQMINNLTEIERALHQVEQFKKQAIAKQAVKEKKEEPTTSDVS